ncbi:MAG: hypothetical protein V1838_00400, partial [Patescibacteria group bacterium]
FRVKVKARFGSLDNVSIIPLDNSSPPQPQSIPNRAVIKSEGSSGDSNVTLTASIPWQLPANSIFDFVIFSEESIEK